MFRRFGIHVTPVHFYSPIPDIRELERQPHLWNKDSQLPGINMNDASHLQLMENVFTSYQSECDFPKRPTAKEWEFNTSNIYYGYVSAYVMHSMVRHHRPKKVIEVGAGNSTYVIAKAALLNDQEGFPAEVTAIDPYPDKTLRAGFPGLSKMIAKKIQDVDLDLLCSLEENDIFSIDTSHAVKTGGDVNFLYLEVLPRLAPGVIIHIHDIFLPEEYPKKWLRQRYFWTEQYLFQAFLIHNSGFEVMWGQKYAQKRFASQYAQAFNGRTQEAENHGSYSFWIRRTNAV